jgi:hypothetical protein
MVEKDYQQITGYNRLINMKKVVLLLLLMILVLAACDDEPEYHRIIYRSDCPKCDFRYVDEYNHSVLIEETGPIEVHIKVGKEFTAIVDIYYQSNQHDFQEHKGYIEIEVDGSVVAHKIDSGYLFRAVAHYIID